jgi:hypothetical protein
MLPGWFVSSQRGNGIIYIYLALPCTGTGETPGPQRNEMAGSARYINFSSIAPLSGGDGLGSLTFTAARYLGSGGCGMLKFLKNFLFQGNLCYHGVDERTRLQEQKF